MFSFSHLCQCRVPGQRAGRQPHPGVLPAAHRAPRARPQPGAHAVPGAHPAAPVCLSVSWRVELPLQVFHTLLPEALMECSIDGPCVTDQVTVLRVFDRIMNDASFLRSPSGREVSVGS
jgi:hypothetical protein